LGWQGHMWHKTLPSGQNILDDLDHFAPYGLPIQITEYDTHERFSDEDDARFMDEFLTAWFSHPLTAGFIMWGFQDAYMWNGNGPLFRNDWSLKPSGKAWMELVFGKWWTEASGPTNQKGRFEVRGFLGDYEVEVRHNGKRETQRIRLSAPGAEATIRLSEKSAPDEPSTRLVSSNPYLTGKLPNVLPPLQKDPATLTTRQVSLAEGKGAFALVPFASGEGKESWNLGAAGKGRPGHDLFLRFDPGVLSPDQVQKATLKLDLAENPKLPVRISIHVLSSRFVPQGQEAGLDWKPEDLVPGRIPGRSFGDGGYRLGDASVILLGETMPSSKDEKTTVEFTSGELTRAVQKAAGHGVTIILSTDGPVLTVAGPGHKMQKAPVLELQLSKP